MGSGSRLNVGAASDSKEGWQVQREGGTRLGEARCSQRRATGRRGERWHVEHMAGTGGYRVTYDGRQPLDGKISFYA